MVITMHLRVGSISEAEKVILIFLLNLSEGKDTMQVYYLFCYFTLVYISLDELFAWQLKKIGFTELAFLQNKAIDMDYCFDLNLLLL